MGISECEGQSTLPLTCLVVPALSAESSGLSSWDVLKLFVLGTLPRPPVMLHLALTRFPFRAGSRMCTAGSEVTAWDTAYSGLCQVGTKQEYGLAAPAEATSPHSSRQPHFFYSREGSTCNQQDKLYLPVSPDGCWWILTRVKGWGYSSGYSSSVANSQVRS
jgi:hypothetical protein